MSSLECTPACQITYRVALLRFVSAARAPSRIPIIQRLYSLTRPDLGYGRRLVGSDLRCLALAGSPHGFIVDPAAVHQPPLHAAAAARAPMHVTLSKYYTVHGPVTCTVVLARPYGSRYAYSLVKAALSFSRGQSTFVTNWFGGGGGGRPAACVPLA